MFDLDLKSRLPIYEQLVEKYKLLIRSNLLETNAQLPSVRLLAQQLSINPNTIQKAYRTLEQEGYIYSLPGKGSFVSPLNAIISDEKTDGVMSKLRALISEAAYLGIEADALHHLITSVYTNTKETR